MAKSYHGPHVVLSIREAQALRDGHPAPTAKAALGKVKAAEDAHPNFLKPAA